MPPYLSDENLESWEDPADRNPSPRGHEDTVEYELQVIMRHAWEDTGRKQLEKKAYPILERVTAPGLHTLPDAEFATLARFVYLDQPTPLRAALKSGVMNWGRTVVKRFDGPTPEADAKAA